MRNSFFNLKKWQHINLALTSLGRSIWSAGRIVKNSFLELFRYIFKITVSTFRLTSTSGFVLLIIFILQICSGIYVAFFYSPDPTFVIVLREELVNELDYFFWFYKTHFIGVDLFFILTYLHMLKKLFLKNYLNDVDGWYTGSSIFLNLHLVTFFGICLSTTHLGDLTVTIAANIFWSLTLFLHKAYLILFLNKHLGPDLQIRFTILHYVLAYFFFVLVQLHTLYIHECWDSDADNSSNQDTNKPRNSWFIDSLEKEYTVSIWAYINIALLHLYIQTIDYRVLNFCFFEQWSEVEVEEINFFIVSPHWYFRAHMGLLTVCAEHYEGLFWLVSFYLFIIFLPNIYRCLNEDLYDNNKLYITNYYSTGLSTMQYYSFVIFVGCIFYVSSVLPCGRFYYEEEQGFYGNTLVKVSYQYIYFYLFFFMHVVEKLENFLIGWIDLVIIERKRKAIYRENCLNKFAKRDRTWMDIILH